MPYLGKQSEQVGVSIQKYEFLQATDTSSGTTSFSVPSDAGDHVNVWLNGVLLVEGGSNDYTTTNTTVVFGTAPADGDIVRIDVVESFALPDALKSSGDTMTGALKLDGGIKQQTSADLSGTYAYHQLMLSDAFTVAGDVTISDNLVLAKLSDDSNAITLTPDSTTRTITGTGSLEASTLAQTPNASLTGMTGTIGSGVTFPTGCVINTVQTATTSTISTDATSYAATSLITTLPSIGSASNKILATLSGGSGGHGNIRTYVKLMESINAGTYSDISGAETNNKFVSGEHQGPFSMNYLFTPNGGSGTTNSVAVRVSIKTSSGTSYLNNSSALLTLTLQEIQG